MEDFAVNGGVDAATPQELAWGKLVGQSQLWGDLRNFRLATVVMNGPQRGDSELETDRRVVVASVFAPAQ